MFMAWMFITGLVILIGYEINLAILVYSGKIGRPEGPSKPKRKSWLNRSMAETNPFSFFFFLIVYNYVIYLLNFLNQHTIHMKKLLGLLLGTALMGSVYAQSGSLALGSSFPDQAYHISDVFSGSTPLLRDSEHRQRIIGDLYLQYLSFRDQEY